MRVALQIITYACQTFAPSPLLRMCILTGGRLYVQSLAALSASNWLMVLCAYGVMGGADSLSSNRAWAALGILTLTAWAAGTAVVMCSPEHMRESCECGRSSREVGLAAGPHHHSSTAASSLQRLQEPQGVRQSLVLG